MLSAPGIDGMSWRRDLAFSIRVVLWDNILGVSYGCCVLSLVGREV